MAAQIIQQLEDTIENLSIPPPPPPAVIGLLLIKWDIDRVIDATPNPPAILIAHNIDEYSLFRYDN